MVQRLERLVTLATRVISLVALTMDVLLVSFGVVRSFKEFLTDTARKPLRSVSHHVASKIRSVEILLATLVTLKVFTH